jgi:hypothetical protein
MSFSELIKKSSVASSPVVDLISDTFLGSRGAQYKLLNTKDRVQNLDNPLFISLERNQTAYGNITICNRVKKNISENYIRYFAFQTRFQSQKEQKTSSKSGNLKKQFASFLNEDVFNKNQSYCYYAFVDQQNYRSIGMGATFGFENIGQFSTTTFSRRKPKKRIKIEEFTGKKKENYFKELEKIYSEYNFYYPVNIEKGRVFGIVEEREIIMACTVHSTNWEVKSLPGKNGKQKIKLLQKTPLLNSFFKNGILRFEGMEGLIVKKPELVNKFLETVLYETNSKTIIWWSDIECPIFLKMKSSLKKGLLARFSKQENALIIAKHNNKNIQNFKKNPTYISAFDVS